MCARLHNPMYATWVCQAARLIVSVLEFCSTSGQVVV
jgi:hypothetical protein